MKKILSLLCLLTVFFAGFAETKTYQLCTDIDEITNPNNQFLIVNAYNGKVYGLTKTPPDNKSGKAVELEGLTTAAEMIQVDADALNLGFFSFLENGADTNGNPYYALYDNVGDYYFGGSSKTDLTHSTSLNSSSNDYKISVSKIDDAGHIKISSVTGGTRYFFFQNGTTFKNYASTNATNSQYSLPLFYKEVIVGAQDPVYSNFKEEYTIQLMDEMNLPAITPAELTYTFTSSDDAVVAVEDGKLVAKGLGEATITFTTAEIADKFNAGQGEFKVTVTKRKPQMEFADQIVYGKLGVTVVWQTVDVTDPDAIENRGNITYSSSDPTIVNVHEDTGQIHPTTDDDHPGDIFAAGYVTITATMEETDIYEAGSASYSIIIIDPEGDMPAQTSSFDFTVENPYGMTTVPNNGQISNKVYYEKNVEEISSGLVSISFSGNYRSIHSTTGNTSDDMVFRLQKEAGMTISVPDTYKITKIGFVGNLTNPTYSPVSKKNINVGNETPEEWEESVDNIWMPADGAAPTSSVTLSASTSREDFKQIYVQYEGATSNLKTPSLSFNKILYAIYVDEPATVNAARNPEGVEIIYSLQNVDESKYTITPSADGKTLEVLVSETGSYTLMATSDSNDEYRDGLAIMRLNVYRHLDITVNDQPIVNDEIDTTGDDEIHVVVEDLWDYNTYFMIVEEGETPVLPGITPPGPDDDETIEGFEMCDDIDEEGNHIYVPANTNGELWIYIAQYGYLSPVRKIKLNGPAEKKTLNVTAEGEKDSYFEEEAIIYTITFPAGVAELPGDVTVTAVNADGDDIEAEEVEYDGDEVMFSFSEAGVYNTTLNWSGNEEYKEGSLHLGNIAIYVEPKIGNNTEGVIFSHAENGDIEVRAAAGDTPAALVFASGASDHKIKFNMDNADELWYRVSMYVAAPAAHSFFAPARVTDADNFTQHDGVSTVTLPGEHGTIEMYTIKNNVKSPVEKALYTNDASMLDDIMTGVAGINAEDGEAIYYNVNGTIVDSNELLPGIYVRVLGGKAEKVLVK